MLPVYACTAGVVLRSAFEMPLLFRIDRAVRSSELIRAARLHFDESQTVALPCDEVNLSLARSRPEITGDDCVPVTAEIPVRQIFAALSGDEIPIAAAPARAVAETVGQEIEEREHA